MLLALTLASGSGGAQGTGSDSPARPRPIFTRAEAGEADINPLFVTARDLGTDLRRPDGFSDLYRISPDALSPYAGRFARISGGGGLVAVFPRGRYTETSKGLLVEIPPDTVYVVGGLPASGFEAPDRPSTRLQARLNQSASQGEPRTGEPLPAARDRSRPLPTEELDRRQRERDWRAGEKVARLFEDDAHRARAVDDLLRGP
ncbi:MAG: hypothetical protein AB7V47_09450 [Phycisphaerales bacterium]